jgi:hypothetical protein
VLLFPALPGDIVSKLEPLKIGEDVAETAEGVREVELAGMGYNHD